MVQRRGHDRPHRPRRRRSVLRRSLIRETFGGMKSMGSGVGSVYRTLVIVATSRETDIWLADDEGFLVQKESGVLDTELLEGRYVVEFGLGTTTYPIHLSADVRYTEEQITSGPSCPRPVPTIK